jgi:sugar transferase (PEP-CTERM/EpsH1 system associated)
MNILYVCHRIPYPPNKGDKIRAFHQIKHLSKEHSVHLACLVDQQADLDYVRPLEKYCSSIDAVYRPKRVTRILTVIGLFNHKPLSVAAFFSRRLQKKISRRLAATKIDRIIIFSSAMAEYVKHISDIPKTMDFVDVDSEKWRTYAGFHRFPFSWLYRLEADRLARFEKEVARTCEQAILVSEVEARLFQDRIHDRPLSVIPNGVDLDFFHQNEERPSPPSRPSVVFIGEMDYFPNVDAVQFFCQEVFPLVRKEVPEAAFYIVGRNPTRPVTALNREPNVTVTGGVPDVRPYLSNAMVAVAPFRIARGIQNKILEAMSMRVPVVGTFNAFQGIKATTGDGVRIADDPRGLAEQVITFLQRPDLRNECGRQARLYVERHHRWETHGLALDALLREPIERSGACS